MNPAAPADGALRVTTVNVNGIRAAVKRGMLDWLAAEAPAVLLLQEVRAEATLAGGLLGEEWDTIVVPSRAKGRAGVAVAVHKDRAGLLGLNSIDEGGACDPRTTLDEVETDVDSGRWVEATVETASGVRLRVVSAYFHSGEKDTPKQEAKMAHLPRIGARMAQLLGKGGYSLVAGDFNIVASASDIKNWRPNHNKSAGVLDEEIVFLHEWMDSGWRDVTRELAGEVQGPYTWWSWRGKAFDNDAGWRIDHQYVTPALAEFARSFHIGRAASWDARFSDHAPLTVDYVL